MQVELEPANLAPRLQALDEKKTAAPPLKARVDVRGKETRVRIDVPDCDDESAYEIGRTGAWVSMIADIVAKLCIEGPGAVTVQFAGHTGARGHLLSQLLLIPNIVCVECVRAHPIFREHIDAILKIGTLAEVGLPFSNPSADRQRGHCALYGVVERQRLLNSPQLKLLRFWDYSGLVSSAFLCEAVRAFSRNTKLVLAMRTSVDVAIELDQMNTDLHMAMPVESETLPKTGDCVLTGNVRGFKVTVASDEKSQQRATPAAAATAAASSSQPRRVSFAAKPQAPVSATAVADDVQMNT